jgi:hypothetical protein
MSFQAYLDNIKAKTGKTPADFAKLAAKKGLTRHGEIVAWLRREFALGHGHATAIAAVLLKTDARKAGPEQRLDALFSGKKAVWRKPCEKLMGQATKFGPDVTASANETYVNLVRGKKKFAILQPSAADRLDIGVKLKVVRPEGRFEVAGSWNTMVTHRIRIGDPAEIDAEVLSWLKNAYDSGAILPSSKGARVRLAGPAPTRGDRADDAPSVHSPHLTTPPSRGRSNATLTHTSTPPARVQRRCRPAGPEALRSGTPRFPARTSRRRAGRDRWARR